MRIVAGKHRGRRLVAPQGHDIRPTSDRVREALFNLLAGAENRLRGCLLGRSRIVLRTFAEWLQPVARDLPGGMRSSALRPVHWARR